MSKKKKKTEQKTAVNEHVCLSCDAPCCRDVTMLITRPRTKAEINELTQYLHYDTANIFVRHRKWYLSFSGKCMYLDGNNMCKKYSSRPPRCRRHNPPDCERFGKWYDVLISSPDELKEYLES